MRRLPLTSLARSFACLSEFIRRTGGGADKADNAIGSERDERVVGNCDDAPQVAALGTLREQVRQVARVVEGCGALWEEERVWAHEGRREGGAE